MLDGLEITQFTYFQQCGGLDLDPISAEITYGLERIAAFLQDVDSVYDVIWARTPHPVTYGEVRHLEEVQFSVYNFEEADVEKLWEHLRLYEAECRISEPGRAAAGGAYSPSSAAFPFWRPTTFASSARISSICSMPGARSPLPSASASSPAFGSSRSASPRLIRA